MSYNCSNGWNKGDLQGSQIFLIKGRLRGAQMIGIKVSYKVLMTLMLNWFN